jgi:hypothetical protein
MAEDLDTILSPVPLTSLKEDLPPVQCRIWKGRDEYDTIELNAYPFDTLDTIKRMICNAYPDDPAFIPRFLFVGVPLNGDEPTMESLYHPMDYLWYANGETNPESTYQLVHPRKALAEPDLRFVDASGTWTSPTYVFRGRSTIEEVFLIPKGEMPVFHVFPLSMLVLGKTVMGEEEWNSHFAPYFFGVPVQGPYRATKEDLTFSKQIATFLSKREDGLEVLNRYLEEGVETPILSLTGIRQMILLWKKPVIGFEGSAHLFYELPVTRERPYLRLLPAEGDPITKLHVEGVLPIPSLEDPRILEGWGKEVSPSPGYDLCVVKYVHRPALSSSPPIYGTIHLLNDGTIKLLIQPPKQIKYLQPQTDFRNFTMRLEGVFDGLPQEVGDFEMKEASVIFSFTTEMRSAKFTKSRILARLPLFSFFFNEIKPLPNENPLISLRYKAVSQYASEGKVFSFITQYTASRSIDGEEVGEDLISALQEEFEVSEKEAKASIAKWHQEKGIFTVQVPEDGEYTESFHPGIDIHIHASHPTYVFHVNRMDGYASYRRIFTLLSLLFIEEDGYFNQNSDRGFSEAEEDMQEESMHQEEQSLRQSAIEELAGKPGRVRIMEEDLFNSDTEEPIAAKPAVSVRSKPADEELRAVNPKSWFIRKLQEIDPKLFDYKTEVEDDNGYSRMCTATDDRQPVIMTPDQYERMRAIYERDPIFWVEYPLEGTIEPIQPLGTEETMTVMRYGSDERTINYYFCPQYYCIFDEIMVRPVDFLAKTDREKKQKEKDTCPFCHGKLIKDKKRAVPGYTVLERRVKKDKFPKYIKFMADTTHPDKWALPCCFGMQATLRISDTRFDRLRTALQRQVIEEEENNDYESLVYHSEESREEYAVLLETIYRKYILEPNAQPDRGKFATAANPYDTFFRQNSTDSIVIRPSVQLKLRANAKGMLRLGIENTPTESLLGLIAPIIHRNTIQEVKDRILEVINPRIFLNSHFGNLVLEFYSPADVSAMPDVKQDLMQWANQHLGISVNSHTLYPLLRIYNAYHRFIAFIRDPTKRKDVRHLQPLLAEPGLFSKRGIQMIILEDHGDEAVTIACPIFGVSMDRNKKNDFVFVSRSMKTVGSTGNQYAHYEIYVHTLNRPAKGGELATHDSNLHWTNDSYDTWPPVIKERIEEYMTQCNSRYRSIYTSQQDVDSMAMIPLSKAVESASFVPEGIVKDTYNHIVGITFRSKPGSAQLVVLPVVDDGIISISTSFHIKNIYLDWEDIKAAPVDILVQYYRNKLEPLFSLYPGYRVKSIARHSLEKRIVAVQLQNGIYIPASDPKKEEDMMALGLPMVSVTQLEWDLNKKITGQPSVINSSDWEMMKENLVKNNGCGVDSELVRVSTYTEWKEWYQQFRMMVSNWIESPQAGSSVRKGIEDIIFHPDLPEYEKRKRLYLFLSSELLTWFYPDPNEWDKGAATFLRKDCRLIDRPDACSGSCYWKEEEGKCLLHVPDQIAIREDQGFVSTSELFTKRVIDELVRFPVRRKQLLSKGEISAISGTVQPIRQGDQYIIPESSPTWTNLLRMEWAKQIPEEVQYYEEMSREEEKQEQPEATLPPALQELLGDTTFTLQVSDHMDPSSPLLPLTSILGVTMEQLGLPEDAPILTKGSLIQYVKRMLKPIGLINLTGQTIEGIQPIQFVKPKKGEFITMILLVLLPDQVGVLLEEGSVDVEIASFPPVLRSRWEEAGEIDIVRKPDLAKPAAKPVLAKPVLAKPVLASMAPSTKPSLAKTAPMVAIENEESIDESIASSIAPSIAPSIERNGRMVRAAKPSLARPSLARPSLVRPSLASTKIEEESL